jgi:hypothetical protein
VLLSFLAVAVRIDWSLKLTGHSILMFALRMMSPSRFSSLARYGGNVLRARPPRGGAAVEILLLQVRAFERLLANIDMRSTTAGGIARRARAARSTSSGRIRAGTR